MNTWQKITVGVLASLTWGISVWISHAYPDLAGAMGEVKTTAHDVLAGLGVYHLLITPPPSKNAIVEGENP